MSELNSSAPVTAVSLSAALRVLWRSQAVDLIQGTHRVSEKSLGQLTIARHRVVAWVCQHLYAYVVGAGRQVGGEAGGGARLKISGT